MAFGNHGPWEPIFGISVFDENREIRSLEELKRLMVQRALTACGGNVEKTARMTLMTPRTIYRMSSKAERKRLKGSNKKSLTGKEAQKMSWKQFQTKVLGDILNVCGEELVQVTKHLDSRKDKAEVKILLAFPAQVMTWEDFENEVIKKVIHISQNQVTEAARQLKISSTKISQHISHQQKEELKKERVRFKIAELLIGFFNYTQKNDIRHWQQKTILQSPQQSLVSYCQRYYNNDLNGMIIDCASKPIAQELIARRHKKAPQKPNPQKIKKDENQDKNILGEYTLTNEGAQNVIETLEGLFEMSDNEKEKIRKYFKAPETNTLPAWLDVKRTQSEAVEIFITPTA